MKIKNSKYKYYEYIDEELILTDKNKNDKLKNPEINFLSSFDIIDHNHKTNLWTILNKKNNKIYKVLFRQIKNSGIENNYSKRIILTKKDFYDPSVTVITYYISSPSKFCFILSNKNEIYNSQFLIDENKINTSIWYSFDCIYEALKENRDIYEIKTKKNNFHYSLYYSTDIFKILDNNLENFILHNKNMSIENQIKIQENKQPIINLFSNIKKNQKYFLDNDDIQNCNNNDDKIIGRIAEKIFNFNLENNIEYISNYFNIKINNYKWVNKEKESFLPYDFILNDEIFVDVKGTTKNYSFFKFSENELEFRKSVNQENYFIFNIFNINSKNNYLFKIYSSDDLNNADFLKTTTYLYDERKNNG